MWRFLSLRYVMPSNVPFEKNKMASALAVSVITTWSVYKMQGGRVPVKVKGNRKRCGEETEKNCNQFSLGKLAAGKLFCKFHTTTKRPELNPES